MTRTSAGVGVETAAPLYKEILADPAAVQARIDDMAAAVIERYEDVHPLFVCLLRGGAPFATRLMTSVAHQAPYFHPEMDYMTISVYKDKLAAGPPRLVMDLAPETVVKGRTVVMLDDTLDKGITADFADKHLRSRGAKEVDLVVLVRKRRPQAVYPSPTMFGFEAPGEKWLTGMGLDDARICKEANRWTGYIAIANEDVPV